jgi:hypothetical protein
LPRPDGAYDLALPCADPTHPLAAAVQRHKLCNQAASQSDVEAAMHIDLATAFAIAHYLNAELRFVMSTPFDVHSPNAVYYPSSYRQDDILDACALHAAQTSSDLAALCEKWSAADDAGTVWFPSYYDSETAIAELVDRLNELYGISTESLPDGGCLARTEHSRPILAYRLEFDSLRYPECVPTCSTPGPTWPYTSDAVPAGACEPGTGPCALKAEAICSCGGATSGFGAVTEYHCACVDGRWECFSVGTSHPSPCACDAGASSDAPPD